MFFVINNIQLSVQVFRQYIYIYIFRIFAVLLKKVQTYWDGISSYILGMDLTNVLSYNFYTRQAFIFSDLLPWNFLFGICHAEDPHFWLKILSRVHICVFSVILNYENLKFGIRMKSGYRVDIRRCYWKCVLKLYDNIVQNSKIVLEIGNLESGLRGILEISTKKYENLVFMLEIYLMRISSWKWS